MRDVYKRQIQTSQWYGMERPSQNVATTLIEEVTASRNTFESPARRRAQIRTAYLRWCMEHDLMGEEFLTEYREVAEKVKADPASVDPVSYTHLGRVPMAASPPTASQ